MVRITHIIRHRPTNHHSSDGSVSARLVGATRISRSLSIMHMIEYITISRANVLAVRAPTLVLSKLGITTSLVKLSIRMGLVRRSRVSLLSRLIMLDSLMFLLVLIHIASEVLYSVVLCQLL